MTVSTGAGAAAALSTTARRVTVVTPRARVDVALPMSSTVAELIPQLVRLSAAESSAPSQAPGWSLRRLGGALLEPGLTVAGSGLRDGDLLYLAPRERAAVPLLFDDVVDAIAGAADERAERWTAAVARRVALAAAVLALLGADVVLALGTGSHATAAIASGLAALVLLLAGGSLSRAFGDSAAGAACAVLALPAAYLAGADGLPDHSWWPITAAGFALGAAAVTVAAVLGAIAIGDRTELFAGFAVAGAGGALAAVSVVLFDWRPASVAAVAVAIATAAGVFAPVLSVRLAQLPLPRVPSDLEDFRDEVEPTDGRDVAGRTGRAEGMLVALLAAFGAVVAGSGLVLLTTDNRYAWALTGVLGVVWAARSRSFSGWRQRLALLLTALVLLAALVARLSLTGDRPTQVIAAAALAVIAVGCLAFAARVVRARRSPYITRLTDAVELLSLVAILPVAGAVIGIYHTLRGIGG